MATSSKDRTGLFADKPEFIITSETGKLLKEWCESGLVVKTELEIGIEEMQVVTSKEEMAVVWKKYPRLQTNPEFVKVKDERKLNLNIQ